MKPQKSKIFKLTLVMAALGVAFSAFNAKADDATAKATLAEQLLSLLNVEKNYDATYQRMSKIEDSMLDKQGLTPDERKQHEQAAEAARAVIESTASWKAIKPTFLQIYADIFTVEELQGMVDFYKSPIGQKWLEKQPLVQAEVAQKMAALMNGLQPKIMAAVKAAQAAQSENQASPSASPGSPVK